MSQPPTSSTRLLIAIGVMLGLGALACYLRLKPDRPADLPNTRHVQGTVKFQGQPLKLGLVVFEPDSAKGGSGAQGFASIQDGMFDTNASGGQSVAKGPCIVRVTGGDGVGVDAFTPFGSLLFDEYSARVEITDQMTPLTIDVPGAQGFRTPERN